MTVRNKGPLAPTFTHLVARALHAADDFVTLQQVMASHPDLSMNRVCASLSHLRAHKAADFMVDGGTTYWYETGEDDRTKTLEEKAREPLGTRRTRRTARGTTPKESTP